MTVGTVPECLSGELLGTAESCLGGGLAVGSYTHA